MRYYKGQFSLVNLIGVFISLLVYFLFVVPVLTPILDDSAVYQQANPNQFTPAVIALQYALPFFILLMIVITALHYAIPTREG